MRHLEWVQQPVSAAPARAEERPAAGPAAQVDDASVEALVAQDAAEPATAQAQAESPPDQTAARPAPAEAVLAQAPTGLRTAPAADLAPMAEPPVAPEPSLAQADAEPAATSPADSRSGDAVAIAADDSQGRSPFAQQEQTQTWLF